VAYYHFDALGSTRLLTDAMGTVTDTYAYDAWGNLMAHNGTTAQPYQFVGQLGYYTHWQDANLTLLQLGVRFYDPEIGRFGQRDPIQDGMNWYAYVRNSPVSWVDPAGLNAWHGEPMPEPPDPGPFMPNTRSRSECLKLAAKRFEEFSNFLRKMDDYVEKMITSACADVCLPILIGGLIGLIPYEICYQTCKREGEAIWSVILSKAWKTLMKRYDEWKAYCNQLPCP